jgi:hypothetical protein
MGGSGVWGRATGNLYDTGVGTPHGTVVIVNIKPDQQSHMTHHLTRILAPGYPCIPMTPREMGTVLHGFSKLKPIPIPMHTITTLLWVYPYPCHTHVIPYLLETVDGVK